MKRSFALGASIALVIGFGAADAKTPVTARTVSGVLNDATGQSHGSVMGTQRRGAITMLITVNGLTPGVHGLHIHAVGMCEGPAFASAGGHWNPAMKMHGKDNPMGAHTGDLPNLTVDAKGAGRAQISVPGTIADLLDADGASVIVHAAADDYKTDPSGNSGARVVCAVLARP